jgi:Rrf2 family protein
MIKLNRTTEYGLIALRHLGGKRELTSAREISDVYGIPFEILAKTLQRLKENGLIQSEQGARGGYSLNRSLDEITLADFLVIMEGPQSVVACTSVEEPAPMSHATKSDPGSCGCNYSGRCDMKNVMSDLNGRVKNFLMGIKLNELAERGTSL